MKRKQNPAITKQARGGDTSRTSSQGRKLSSGGEIDQVKKGSPEKDENSKAEIAEQNSSERSRPRRS
jgi:hypothetical protein